MLLSLRSPIPLFETVDEIIHQAIFNVALTAAEMELIAVAPWLKLPIVSQVFDFTMKQLAGLLYQKMVLIVNFDIIDFKTQAEKNAYAKAELALRAAHLSGDLYALAQATDDFKAALCALVRFGMH